MVMLVITQENVAVLGEARSSVYGRRAVLPAAHTERHDDSYETLKPERNARTGHERFVDLRGGPAICDSFRERVGGGGGGW